MNQAHFSQRAVLRFSTTILFVLFVSTAALAQLQVTNYNGASAVADEALIRLRTFEPGAVARVRALLPQAAVNPLSTQLPLFLVRAPGPGLAALLSALANHPDVLYAEPNYVVTAIKTPNDTFYSTLYGMARISAPSAWDLTTGGTSAVIGVVDTGVDYTHPDLAANIWNAPSTFIVTIGGVSIVCPAGSHGFNAITRTCDPLDDNDHGTHTSGTIGAVGNNNLGVVGVNWTARIMGLKFLNFTGQGATSAAIDTMEFARQVKRQFAGTATPVDVRVLSNSWGSGTYSQALLDEINLTNLDEMLFVASAGNSSANNDVVPSYPANYNAPNIISVAATTSSDTLAGFSNYGANTVHLGAPGQSINSTVRAGGYNYFSGTSMAAPHVSGAALLTLSVCPSLNTAALKNAILNNVDHLSSLQGYTITGGRLNVDKALRSCISTITLVSSANPATVGSSVTFTATVTSSNNPTGTVAFTDNGSTIAGCGAVPLSGSGNTKTAACTTSSLSAGTHSIVASYSGDANDPPLVSAPLSQTMNATGTGGLVGYWALNETSGTTAFDSSGNNNNGTLVNGPVWTSAGRVGGALQFDGVNDYVSLGNPPSMIPGNTITLAGWMKLSNLSVNRFLISKYAGPTPTFLRYESGVGVRCVIGGTGVTASASIVGGQWYHTACTYDGATIRVYVNGAQVATGAKTGPIADAVGSPWALGAGIAGNGTPVALMNGLLDEMRLYNIALTASDIALLSNPTAPDTNPPVLSNGSPSGTLPAGTTQTTLSVTTDENATCRYSTVAGTSYAAMTNTFSTTGGTSHSTTVTGLSNGNSYSFYVRCVDAAGNANPADYTISFSVASATPPPDITTGLKGYWALNETAGTTASDSSGNNNSGTLMNGPVWNSAGRVNGALQFDGVNDYVSLGNPASLIPGNAITLAGWMNLSDLSATRFLVAKYAGPTPTFLRYERGVGIRCVLGGTGVTAAASIVTGQWYHAACTYDGATVRVYVNGAEVATAAKTGPIADATGVDWAIGAGISANGTPLAFMNGLIDEVRMYNRALTAADIGALNNP